MSQRGAAIMILVLGTAGGLMGGIAIERATHHDTSAFYIRGAHWAGRIEPGDLYNFTGIDCGGTFRTITAIVLDEKARTIEVPVNSFGDHTCFYDEKGPMR
jgi:hypothetical protein